MSRQVRSSMTSSAALIAFIAAVFATISGLAYASPADPTWIPGVYDDADFDDVVGLVTSAEALATAASSADLSLVTPRKSPQAPLRESAILRFPTATLHARAPPAR